MNIEYHKIYSSVMGGDMELKVYGHYGKPVLVFPCQGGRFFDWEDNRMFDAIHKFIDDGQFKFFTIDSIDKDPWANPDIPLEERGKRHLLYEKYVTEDVVPLIHKFNQNNDKIITTGCSMGAYHAVNFALRFPDLFDGCIALSGVMRLNSFIGDYTDEIVEQCTPITFIDKIAGKKHIEKLKNSRLIICTGQGAWEDLMIEDAKIISYVLWKKKIPAWIDFWGKEVNHDWPWWKIQMPYFLDKILQD